MCCRYRYCEQLFPLPRQDSRPQFPKYSQKININKPLIVPVYVLMLIAYRHMSAGRNKLT